MKRLMRMTRSMALLGLLGPLVTAQAAGADDGTVRILVLTDLTGIYSDWSGQGSVVAAEMAAAETDGEAAGTDVEIVVRDSGLDADTAVAQLREVNADTPVDMVVGLSSSSAAIAVQRFAERHDIITLHSGASSAFFSGEECSPLAVQWGFNTYALAHSIAAGLVNDGAKRWHFITADYSFGHDVQQQVADVVTANGGEVVGESLVPYPANRDEMTQAVAEAGDSDASAIGLANAGEDLQLAIRQIYEQGLGRDGIAPVAIEFYTTDIRRLGIYVTAGLRFATSFYWSRNATAREWSQRFQAKHGAPPTSPQAGVYSATLHYLEAVEAAGTDAPKAVMAAMRERPVDDGVFTDDGEVLINSRMRHDMLLVQVKQPTKIERARDYLEITGTVPGQQAFRSPQESGCPLVD
ncbi:ABC transporter substrate-binding protein [Arhodomonas sp. AD133]|uniref:ABC transporter substrate-binding protein n=1 Tax=Arhodomonas sp. AD133 TaxID=3415009 RepID=UPI003EBC63BE